MHERPCRTGGYVPGEELENTVLIALVRMFGDPEELKKAVERAVPNAAGMKQLEEEQASLLKEREETRNAITRIVRTIGEGKLLAEEAQPELERLRGRMTAIESHLAVIQPQLEAKPDREHVQHLSKMALQVMDAALQNQKPEKILKKPFEWKRRLVEHCFAGEDRQERPLGVYVTREPGGRWMFEIHGILDKVLTCGLLGGKPLENVELGISEAVTESATY
jgi:hypothetical protein